MYLTTLKYFENFNLTDEQKNIILSIDFEKNKKQFVINKVREYVLNGYSLNVLCENFTKICELGRDSSSLKACIIRYGEEKGNELFIEKVKKSTLDKEKYIEINGIDAYKEMRRKARSCLDGYIERHGEEEGRKKWDLYLKNRKETYTRKRENGHIYPSYNLEYYVRLHGEEKGKEIYYKKINSQRYKVSKQYYIDTYGPVDGPILCRLAKDNTSLNSYQKRHGEVVGLEKYRENCKKSINISSFSKQSKRLFDELNVVIGDLLYYAEKELILSVDRKHYFSSFQQAVKPDLFYRGKIIEYNGDLFHANPDLFESSDKPHPFRKNMTSADIWVIDNARIDYYNYKGYKSLVVWENEYKTKKEEVINKCLNFLMN